MAGLRFLWTLMIACWLPASLMAAPLQAYGRLPSLEQLEISPGGGMIASIATDGETRYLIVKDLVANKIVTRALIGTAKIRLLRWAGDKQVIIVNSVTANPADVQTHQREWMMAFAMDVSTGKARPLMQGAEGAMNTIRDIPQVRIVDGKPAIFVQGIKFVDGEGRLSLFRIDPDRLVPRLIATGDADTRDWAISATGEPAGQSLYNLRSGRWSMKLKARNGWNEVAVTTALRDPPAMLGLAADGTSILYTGRDEANRPIWRSVDVSGATPANAPVIPVSADQRPVYDERDGRLLGHYAEVGDRGDYTFYAPQDAKAWAAVIRAFKGSAISLVSMSADHRTFIVKVDAPGEEPAFSLIDMTTGKATWIGGEYAGIGPEDVSPQRSVRFKARDGLALGGYLTTPRGKAEKNLPLIVFPHGGPASRDGPGFDWWAQGMASRGYAVLQVNFRGSYGFGDDLLVAGYGQWGRKMQTDLSDGVRYLAGTGAIDPSRVCIVGASYGGYAALAGASLDTGVYRCAASYSGISDLKRMVAWSKDKQGPAAFRYWTRFMGAQDGQDQTLVDVSPAAQVGNISIPVLLIHGRDDSVVPLEQSRIMADALQKAGKPVELLILKGEDHWLSRGATRLEMLTATMAFVEKHNPPN